MLRSTRTFLHLPFSLKCLAVRVMCQYGYFLFQVRVCKFERYSKKFKSYDLLEEGVGREGEIERYMEVVEAVSKYFPKKSNCLVASIVLKRILNRKGIRSKLCVGIVENPHQLHAWVECGQLKYDKKIEAVVKVFEIE